MRRRFVRGARALVRRLDVRIVALFLSLLLVVQLSSFAVIREGIERNARRAVDAQLESAERLLRRLIAQQAQTLAQAARLLAADYGFRSAVATGDRETLGDALANQAERVGATAALFTDAAGRLQAATVDDAARILPRVQAQVRAAAEQDAARIVVVDGRPMQLVTVPVKAPTTIGWVALGFPLDRATLDDLRQLSMVPAAILAREDGATRLADSVLEPTMAAGLQARLPATPRGDAVLAGDHYATLRVPLASGDGSGDAAVEALLLRSVDEAVAPYRRLQLTLAALTALGALAFGVGSIAMARRVTRPIQSLARHAERLGAGDYETPVGVAGTVEVEDLARTLDGMRGGIRERDRRISRLAYEDELTGLPNRAALRERLATALSRGEPLALLMLDLDRFKLVNDVLGHAFGDRLLRAIAQRLAATLAGPAHAGTLLARLGGDEFALLVPGADAISALATGHALLAALEAPFEVDDQAVDVGGGLGLAVAPDHGGDADTLISRAEIAMYVAKRRQAGAVVYDASLDSASAQSLTLMGEMRRAVEQGELRLYLQPKVDLRSGRVSTAEALVRWLHPQRGLVPPMQFIPFAEQTGYIRVLTQWVIEAAARARGELAQAGVPLKLAVNLSTRDLMDLDLPVKLERVLARHALPAGALCLEITESAIMDDPQRAEQTLARLHAMGLSLSIDDFGTGYSSLAYLKKLPVDQLKIDRSFVMNMETDVADAKIVRSTIDLAHNLGLRVVAEGVETLSAYALLRDGGCDEAQGYLIARPMPVEDFLRWHHGWRPPVLEPARDGAALTPA